MRGGNDSNKHMFQTKMDFTKPDSKKVADLLGTRLLMFDEVSTCVGAWE